MSFTNKELFVRRARSLQRAADRAQNPDFKDLWNNMLDKLIAQEKARATEKGYDTIH